jgi:hypothetical protein
MKLLIDINEDPVRSASNQGKLFNELYWKDTVDLQIAFTDEGNEPSWVGTGTLTIKLTDDENNDLTDTEVMQWTDTEVRHYLELSDTRLDVYLDGETSMPVNMVIRFDDGNFRQTLTKQTFFFYNTFVGAFTITLTLPAEPDLLEVSEEHEPNAPDQLVVAKFPKPVLEIDALIIDGTEEYTPYEPSNVIALNLFVCRPPQQVEADTTPLAPDQLALDRSPLEPDQLDSDRSPLEPDQLATAISPLAPSLVTSSASPFAPQNLVVGIDDFAVSRFSPVVHMDATQEASDISFDTQITVTNYDFKLENSTNPDNSADAPELDGYWKYTGTNQYTRIRPLDKNTWDYNFYNEDLWVIEKVGSTWTVRRFDRLTNTYLNNSQTIAGGSASGCDFAENSPTQTIPDTVPWADFTQGAITSDLHLQSVTNYGDTNYSLENTNYWQQPEGGYRINGNNAIYFGGTSHAINRYSITNPWNYEPIKNLSQTDLGATGTSITSNNTLPSDLYLKTPYVGWGTLIGGITKYYEVVSFYSNLTNGQEGLWAQTHATSPNTLSSLNDGVYVAGDSYPSGEGPFGVFYYYLNRTNQAGDPQTRHYLRAIDNNDSSWTNWLNLGKQGNPPTSGHQIRIWDTDGHDSATGLNVTERKIYCGETWGIEDQWGLLTNHYDEFEIFFVLDPVQGGAGHLFKPTGQTNSDTNRFLAHTPWSNNNYYFYAGHNVKVVSANISNPQDPAVFHCSSSRKLDKYRISVNGIENEKTDAIYMDAGTEFAIPAIPTPQDILIGEMIFFRNTIGVDRAREVEGYLAHKWGINSSLPDTHPWKYIKPYNADDLLGDYTYPIRPSHLVVT